jgi:hypothetical protein
MASNLRVLVSNLGDGNWTPIYNTATPPVAQDSSPNMVTEDAAHDVVFFPPGSSKGAVPTVSEQIGSSVDTIGWGSKTNWMFQLDNVESGSTAKIDISIYGYRPTGVVELIKAIPGGDLTAGTKYSYGGVGGEEVYGPFVAFKFEGDRLGTVVGSPKILCYVIGWNYGDISDNQIEIT